MLGGTKEKDSARWARSAAEFIRMSSRLSHWESDVVVHLLRPLGGDQQVEAELAALGGDLDGVPGGEGRPPGFGVLGAHVVGLVDHDQDGPPVTSVAPQRVEDGLGDHGLLLGGVERAQVDHQAAPVVLEEQACVAIPRSPAPRSPSRARRGWRPAGPAVGPRGAPRSAARRCPRSAAGRLRRARAARPGRRTPRDRYRVELRAWPPGSPRAQLATPGCAAACHR